MQVLMRLIAATLIALGLAACATPAERAAQAEREVDRMIEIYGSACNKLGYQTDSDPWRDCILRLDSKDNLERYSRAPTTTTCFGRRGFFQCSAF